MNNRAYLDYIFAGVRPFTNSLQHHNLNYELLKVPGIDDLYAMEEEILIDGKDSVIMGKCTKEGKTIYFLQFGILLDEPLKTYIAFIYDHSPTYDEARAAALDIGPLTIENLQKIKQDTPKTPPKDLN